MGLVFIEEKLLKVQSHVIAQKIAVINMKKVIAEEQKLIAEEIEKRGARNRGTRIHIDLLEQALNLREWHDPQFIGEQQGKIQEHKRKLDEYQGGDLQIQQLQAHVRHLENNMETEVQLRKAAEKAKLDEEKGNIVRYLQPNRRSCGIRWTR